MKTEHLLIIRFSAMGDVAMAVPVVKSLAQQYPDLRITVLSRPLARPLFDGLAPNVGFMGADIKGEYRGLKGLNALYRRLTAKNFTAIADLHCILRSSYLRMRFNIDRYRVEHIDKHRAARRALTATHDKRLEPLPTLFDDYADVLARLGYPVRPEFTSIFPDGGGRFDLIADKTGTKLPGEQWIGIAPFAAHKGKAYPTDQMERVVELLLERRPHCRIFLFGGGADERDTLTSWEDRHERDTLTSWEGRYERDTLASWEGRHERCTCASTLLGSLYRELVLMSHLDVMVSMDNAYMHLASLTATRVVSVWGATHPFAGFTGWRQAASDAVQAALPCRPCSILGNKPCLRGDYACLTSIKPEEIVERAL